MMNMKELARTFRLPETTTPEDLGSDWSTTLNFGNHLILAGYYNNGRGKNGFFGAVYAFTTDDHSCEGEIRLTAVSEEFFKDEGHAAQWAMAQC